MTGTAAEAGSAACRASDKAPVAIRQSRGKPGQMNQQDKNTLTYSIQIQSLQQSVKQLISEESKAVN